MKIGIIAAVLFLGGAELYDFTDALQHRTDSGNYLSEPSVKKATPGHLNPTNYQAILPIPFYCVGSEDYDYTIDDNDWSTYTFQLQLNTGLPLMSCKMSRTPPLYSKMLTEFVAYDSLNVELKEKLSRKPILVAVCRRMLTDVNSANRPNNDNAAKLFVNSMQFVERHHLAAVDSTADGIFFYNYYPEL